MTIRYRRGALVLYLWPRPRDRSDWWRPTPWPGAFSRHVYVRGQLFSADVGRPAPAGPPAGARDRRD